MNSGDQGATERRFLGVIEVDSGTILVGDPAFLLPDRARAKSGVDYSELLKSDPSGPATRAGELGLLVHDFGGDGAYAVYGEFADDEFVRLYIDLEPIELDGES